MKIKFLCLAVLFNIFSIALIAQKNKCRFSSFETELIKFRHSLFKDLEEIDADELNNVKFLSEGHVKDKIDEFVKEHEKDLVDYHIQVLEKYSVFTVDTTGYVRDSTMNEYRDELNNLDELTMKEYFNYLKMNPLEFIYSFVSIYLSRQFSMDTYASYALKSRIAYPLIATENKDKKAWNVFYDNYNFIFCFTYNVEDMSYKLSNIYRRKDTDPVMNK